MESFAAGAVFYQIGFTVVIVLVEIIIADITSLRSRVFLSYVPALPFLVNTWISGNVSSAALGITNWRWGIGMWCIIYPICCIPLVASLMWANWMARKSGALDDFKTPYQTYGPKKLVQALFWQLDVPGIILMIAVFGCILVVRLIYGHWKPLLTTVAIHHCRWRKFAVGYC